MIKLVQILTIARVFYISRSEKREDGKIETKVVFGYEDI